MPRVNVELNIPRECIDLPIIWRLGRLFSVVTNIKEARVSSEYGVVSLDIEGSTDEVSSSVEYLKALGVLPGTSTVAVVPDPPEAAFGQLYAIHVRLRTVNTGQSTTPVLARVARDFRVILNIGFAAFDQEEGGTVDLTISGALLEVQRSIAYLHTTGLSVSPRERSVSDNGNL